MSSTGSQDARRGSSPPVGGKQSAETKPKGSGQPTMPPRRTWLWFLGVLAVNFLLAKFLMPGAEGPVTVPYTLFKEEVTKGNVQAIHSRADVITGKFKSPVTYPRQAKRLQRRAGHPPRRASAVQRLRARPRR
jgi:hypothetical protein